METAGGVEQGKGRSGDLEFYMTHGPIQESQMTEDERQEQGREDIPMDASDVAKMLGVSESWVRDHAAGRRRPVLPSWKTSDGRKGHFRFLRSQIEAWISRQTKT
jgi:hypothetical protein